MISYTNNNGGKEQQYERHMAYCRKSEARTRPRSCQACNQAKIKCNYSAPCHQCVRKGTGCVYGQQLPRQRRDRAASKASDKDRATAVPNKVPLLTTPTSIDSQLMSSTLRTETLQLGLRSDDLL